MRQSQKAVAQLVRFRKAQEKARRTPKSERQLQAERRVVALMEQALADLQRDEQRRALEERLRHVGACFLHEAGDPKLLN